MVEIWTRMIAVEKETVVNKSESYLQRKYLQRLFTGPLKDYIWNDVKKVPLLNTRFYLELEEGSNTGKNWEEREAGKEVHFGAKWVGLYF